MQTNKQTKTLITSLSNRKKKKYRPKKNGTSMTIIVVQSDEIVELALGDCFIAFKMCIVHDIYIGTCCPSGHATLLAFA